MWTPGTFLNFVFKWLYKILMKKYLFGLWPTNLSLTEKQSDPGQYFVAWFVSHGQTVIQPLLLIYEVCPCRRLMWITVLLQLVRQFWKVLENPRGESSGQLMSQETGPLGHFIPFLYFLHVSLWSACWLPWCEILTLPVSWPQWTVSQRNEFLSRLLMKEILITETMSKNGVLAVTTPDRGFLGLKN